MLLAGAVVLIMTGSFHGDEMHARDGERWLGLFRNGNAYAWRHTNIRVEREHDEIVDAPGENTGKRVSVPGNAVILIRGMDKLANAKVRAASWPGSDVNITVPGNEIKVGDSVLRHDSGRLILRQGSTKQVLYACGAECDEPNWTLEWAGDMDGDGRLDLLVNASSHYNVTEMRLLLSSHARLGELVREVAVFRTTGC